MKVTRNWCLDRLKGKKPVYIDSYHSWYDRRSEESDPQKILENTDKLRLLHVLLDKLPEQQRLIMQLRELEGMEFEEIAIITDMNINAIRVNLSRARNKIREEMINYESDGYQSYKKPAGKIL
jgi:RNA polymerase sigma factor (sigma-70 family)